MGAPTARITEPSTDNTVSTIQPNLDSKALPLKTASVMDTASIAGAASITGIEWVIDAFGCDAQLLRNLDVVKQLCERVISDLGLKVVGEPQGHRFGEPGGVTAMYMLSESHLACHTYPERQTATFNLYCCRARPSWNWESALVKDLGAASVQIQTVLRGHRSDRESIGIQQSEIDA